MTFYSGLTADHVAATYTLFRFLERLKVIGHITAHTEQNYHDYFDANMGDPYSQLDIFDFTGADYTIVKDGYTNDKGYIDAVAELERIFGKLKTRQLRGTY